MVTRAELEAHAAGLPSPYKTPSPYSAEEIKQARREDPNIFGDILRGVASGAEGAVKSLFDFTDAITPGNLPDPWEAWNKEERFVDRPQTLVGNLVAGVTQFATVFIPGNIVIQGASKIPALSFLSAVPARVTALSQAGKTTQAMLLNAVWQGGTAGPIADFLAFSEDEERLSNLIQTSPSLANPITEYLAADKDDGVFEGRLKNVIEGLIVGGALSIGFDSAARSLKRLRGVRKAVEAGTPVEEAIRKAATDLPEPIEPPAILAVREGDTVSLRPSGEVHDTTIAGVTPSVNKLRDDLANEYASIADRQLLKETLGDFGASLDDPRNLNVNPRNLGADELDELGITRGSPNQSVFGDSDDSLAKLFRTASDKNFVAADPTNPTVAEVISRDIEGLGRAIGAGPRDYTKLIAKLKDSPDQLSAIARSARLARNLGEKAGVELKDNIRNILDNFDAADTVVVRELVARVRQTTGLLEAARDVASRLGFELRNQKLVIHPEDIQKNVFRWDALDQLDALASAGITTSNKARVVSMLKEIESVMGNPNPLAAMAGLERWTNASAFGKSGMVAREYFMNSILSNPASWVVNSASGLAMGPAIAAEKMLGAKFLAAVHPKNAAYRQLIADETSFIRGFYNGISEAIEVAKRTGGLGVISGGKFENVDDFSAIRHTLRGKGDIAEAVGKVLTVPSWAMGRGDAVLKISAYRAHARTQLYKLAAKNGIPAEAASDYVERSLEYMTLNRAALQERAGLEQALPDAIASGAADIGDDLGKRIDYNHETIRRMLEIHEEGIKRGEDITFSGRGGKGFFQRTGSVVSQWVHDYPGFGFMLPFINTPANIAQYTWDRTFGGAFQIQAAALNKLSTRFLGKPMSRDLSEGIFTLARELQSSDPIVRANAFGRVAVTSASMTAMLGMAMVAADSSGLPRLTGGGPQDREERRALEEAGWQPYSIRVGGKYYSYQRFDPFAGMLGMAADYAEISAAVATSPDTTLFGLEASATAIVGAVAHSLTNKTYMQGLSNLLDVASGDERTIASALGGLTAGFVPSVLAGQVGAVDPNMREIRSLLDRIKTRIPGLSSTLAPRRNLLGEKVVRQSTTGFTVTDAMLPIRSAQIKDDVIAREVASLKFGFNIPSLEQRGLDLTSESYNVGGQDAYDRYMELSGQVKVGGLTLRQALRKLINDPGYQRITDTPDPETGSRSPRVDLINATLAKYRKTAWTKLLKERPALADAVKQTKRAKARPTLLN